MAESDGGVLRARGGDEQRTTWLELFFDLVFVFAVTQLSHLLRSHLDLAGAAQTVFLLLAVWWAWTYTAWMTNWYDPDSPLVRALLIAVMLAGLLMALAVPEAFGERGLLFAAAYTALQVGRNAFAVVTAEAGSDFRRSMQRILAWSLAAAPLWLAGGAAGGGWRALLWVAALAVDYAGPLLLYWLPRAGRARSSDWAIEGAQFAERFQLFVLIALGESIVVTGASGSQLGLDAARVAAIALAFLNTAALWWLYFDYVARIAQRRLELAEDPGSLGRDAYTYLHLPLVAGIIAAAVADALVIAHPGDHLGRPALAVLAAAPTLYLLGHVAFRLRMAGSLSRKRLLAAAAAPAAVAAGAVFPALVPAALVVCVLVALIAAELVAGRRRRVRGEEAPLERVERAASARAQAGG